MLFIYIILFIILPAIVTFLVEWFQIRDIQNTIDWMLTHPVQTLLGFCLILLVFMMMYIATCNISLAMLGTSGTLITLGLINYYKVVMRGDPFMPWDLVLKKEAINIITYIDISLDKETILVLGALIIIIIALGFLKPKKIKWRYRLVGIFIGLSVITLFMNKTYFNNDKMKKLGVEDIFWNQKRNYEINGFLTGFSMNIPKIMIKAPTEYSEKNINEIIEEYEKSVPVFENEKSNKQPNIIIIMNEAFWDPTVLSEITYSQDPIPTIRKIRNEGISGWLLSPEYGGGTANIEFEVLTGHSVSFLPPGSMAYQQYVNKPLGSMASYLKEAGYATIAIHPYQKWFWDRENVYPYLGFEQFISDEDFINPHKRGQFISDVETSHEIIRQYEKHKGKPFFNYTVTMQNHGPYNDRRYGDDIVKVKGKHLSQDAKDILQTYVEGVKDSDKALGDLIDYFKSVEDPTIIVMFGDHLPMLGNEYAVYKDAGYISEGELTLEDKKNLHLTPLVIWNNYGNKKQDIGIINASYLGPYVMDFGNMKMPTYFDFLNQLHQDLPSYIRGLKVGFDGSLEEKVSNEEEILRQKHWMLQYDLIFGKGYSGDVLFGQ